MPENTNSLSFLLCHSNHRQLVSRISVNLFSFNTDVYSSVASIHDTSKRDFDFPHKMARFSSAKR